MKAICVFSGGLDSILAAEAIRRQHINVIAIFFETPFFRPDRARATAERFAIPFKTVDITSRHLSIVLNPPHGYGANMNPCIDCHALMFKAAGELLEAEGARFLVTGEVLGQRPFSQNKSSLKEVERMSGRQDLIVRPLSARLLPPSLPEREGWINRDLLYGFQGRSRKAQIRLAEEWGIRDYEAPAGGCLLTDKYYTRRLKDLFLYSKGIPSINEIELLRLGRHLRLNASVKVIVGRNKAENERINHFAGDGDVLMTAESYPGPTVLVSGTPVEQDIIAAANITLSYSDAETGQSSLVRVEERGRSRMLPATALPRSSFQYALL